MDFIFFEIYNRSKSLEICHSNYNQQIHVSPPNGQIIFAGSKKDPVIWQFWDHGEEDGEENGSPK